PPARGREAAARRAVRCGRGERDGPGEPDPAGGRDDRLRARAGREARSVAGVVAAGDEAADEGGAGRVDRAANARRGRRVPHDADRAGSARGVQRVSREAQAGLHEGRLIPSRSAGSRDAVAGGAGGAGRIDGSSFIADLISSCAETGAVRNRNSVIRNSCTLGLPPSTVNQIDETISTQPTPSVVAFVGPCSRFRKSDSFASPQEPTSAKNAPASSSAASSASSQKGRAVIRTSGSGGRASFTPRCRRAPRTSTAPPCRRNRA